jgi:hypothetical protein
VINRRQFAAAIGAVCLALVGCGGLYDATVTGMVTLDGAPVPRGAVKFVPDRGGAPAYGIIESDGAYSIMIGREPGLPSGAYTVTVVANEPSTPSANSATPPAPGKPLSPPWYRDVATTPLKQSVAPGKNQIDLQLSKTPPAGWKPPKGR